MKRLFPRGAIGWAAFGLLVFACSGDPRKFIDPDADAGSGGEGLTGSGGTTGGSSTGGSAGVSGSSGEGGTSTGGVGGSAGSAGDAGSGPGGEGGGSGGEPEPPPPPGRPGTALVAGGKFMRSTNYRLFLIDGNGSLPVNSSSTNYRLNGGIVGTTQP
jgi:hypothetical protein